MAAPFKKRAGTLSAYRDQQFQGSLQEQEEKLRKSTTLYVGNLSFFTTEDQIYHLFAKSGDVKRVVMGLDRFNRTPCGFCFVEYYTRTDAEDSIRYVSGTRLDERIIRCDWDAGFVEGRQYGRGKSGGQVRDEFRNDYDAGRGGFGKLIQHRVDKFGPMDGPLQRPFQRGKRKWQDEENEDGDGQSADRTTDLRLKLRKMQEDRVKDDGAEGSAAVGMEENTDPLRVPENESTDDQPVESLEDSTKTDHLESLDTNVPGEKISGDAEMEAVQTEIEKVATSDGSYTQAAEEEMETESVA